MKGKGVNLPTRNLSGSGSIFRTSVNTTSSAFRTAFAGCESTPPAFAERRRSAPDDLTQRK